MTKEKEITKPKETAIVAPECDGLADAIDKSDINIPRIVIVQPTSQLDATTGKLVDLSTNEEMDGINAVFLSVRKARVRWVKDENGRAILDKPPMCTSKDSMVGQGEPGTLCEHCDMGNWSHGIRPECDLKYNFLGLNMDTLIPFVMSIGGTSFKEGKKVITKAVMSKKAVYSFKVNVRPELVQSQTGKYYKYVFTIGENVEEDQMTSLKQMKDDFEAQTIPDDVPAPVKKEEEEEDEVAKIDGKKAF